MSGNALVLKFGTDFSDARRQLPALAGDVARNMATVSAAAIGASRALMTLGSGASSIQTALGFLTAYKVAMLAASAAVAVATAAISAGLEQVAKLADVARNAEKAGVSTDFFQAWESQAVRFKASAQEMTDALMKFGEAAKSSVSEQGERVNSTIERVIANLVEIKGLGEKSLIHLQLTDSVEEKFRTVLQLAGQLYEKARQTGDEQLARFGDKLLESFGPKWQEIRDALKGGALDVDQIAQKMREAGTLADQGLVKASAEVSEQLRKAEEHLSTGIKPFLIDIAALGVEIKSGWVGVVEALAWAVDKAAALYQFAKGIGDVIAYIATTPVGKVVAGVSNANAMLSLQSALENKYGVSNYDLSPEQYAKASKLDPRAYKGGAEARDAALKAAGFSFGNTPSYELDRSGLNRGGGSKGAQTDQVESLLRSLEKQNAALAGEAAAIGKSNVERQKSIDLARAEEAAKERGTPLTEAERQSVLNLAQAHAELKAKIDDATKAKEQMRQAEQFFGDAAVTAVDGLIIRHQKLKDVLSDVLKSIEQAALKSLFLGQGPLSGLFGTAGKDGAMGGLFGGLFGMFSTKSAGGVAGTGPFALAPVAAFAGAPHFADGGGIPSILHAGEIVLNAAQQKNVAGAMGQGVTVHNYAGVNVEPRLTQKGVELLITEHMAQGFRAYDSGLVGNLREKQSRQF